MDALAQLKASLASRYAIEREIGRGGMATVYLARDVRHARNVALKVLNPELGAVLGVERFLSEIQVTANLQHPNLLPLFDSGEADGQLFYVMPFIDGESLRSRLQHEKQLPIDEAIHLATSVASALDYAHRHGVIHRDLKPENILLHEGQPLVADFGIALAVSVAGGARITQTGISLGTPHYMSPEQATGDRPIDQRSDIYSLGAVLYEMLSGDPPHTASTAQAVIAKVLTDQPRSIRMMRPLVPPHVDAAIIRALEKLPADRWNSAHEFADALHGKGVALPADLITPGSLRRDMRGSRLRRVYRSPVFWAAAFAAAVGVAAWGWLAGRRASPESTVRFMLSFPANERIYPGVGAGHAVAISPDGRAVAYVSQVSGGVPRLVVRSLDEVVPRVLSGTEGAANPFFSPDGKWVAFMGDQQLRKVRVEGGPVSLIADVGQTYGAHWGKDDRIVVSIGNQLAVVPGTGATRLRTVTTKDSVAFTMRWPRMLDDGKTVLYTRWTGGITSAQIGVASLETGETRLLNVDGSSPLGVVDGLLLYAASTGALFGIPFDEKRLRTTGNPIPVVERVAIGGTGAAIADFSANGSLVYQSGSASSYLVMYDTTGVSRPLLAEAKGFLGPRFSPDSRRIAVSISSSASTDVYVYSVSSGTLTRLTTEGSINDRPDWSPDGKHVMFRSERDNDLMLQWQAADFSAPSEHVLKVPERNIWEGVFTPDGKSLVYRTGTIGSANIFIRSLTSSDTTPRPIATTSFTEWCPRVSPNGRWIAYSSDESRIMQVYVRALDGPGARIQVSVDGGSSPMWSRDGRKLYYLNNQQMLVADVTTSPPFVVHARKKVFEGDFDDRPGHANYDVAPDGKHFLMVKPSVSGDLVTVVHNWRAELRARLRASSAAQ